MLQGLFHPNSAPQIINIKRNKHYLLEISKERCWMYSFVILVTKSARIPWNIRKYKMNWCCYGTKQKNTLKWWQYREEFFCILLHSNNIKQKMSTLFLENPLMFPSLAYICKDKAHPSRYLELESIWIWPQHNEFSVFRVLEMTIYKNPAKFILCIYQFYVTAVSLKKYGFIKK